MLSVNHCLGFLRLLKFEMCSATINSKIILFFFKENGETSVLSADLVILGIGVYPATNYLKDCNVQVDEHGHVVTNKFMQSSVDNIFAAGDIAKFPLDLPTIKTNVAIGKTNF